MFVKYGWDPHKDRLLGTFFDPNLIGAFFTLGISLILGVILHEKKKNKWLIALMLITVLALALTLSRSAYIALMGGFAVITLLKSRKIFISGVIIILLGIAFNPTISNRISQGVSIDDSASKHIESWVDGIHIISLFPVLGVGYNMLPSVYSDLALVDEWDVNNRSGIENSLFTVWVTTGILGLLSYLFIWISVFVQAYKNWNNKKLSEFIRGLNLGALGGIVAVFLSSVFVNVLFFSYIVIFLWFISAFVMLSANLKKTN